MTASSSLGGGGGTWATARGTEAEPFVRAAPLLVLTLLPSKNVRHSSGTEAGL